MEPLTIKISQHIKLNKGITPDEAQPIYNMEVEAFQNSQKVILDFSDVELLTTAFLNVLIGNLYKDYSSEQLKSMLELSNYDLNTARRIKSVTENAKSFYNDQKGFSQVIEEVLDED